jgi:NitT/TauT family transport system permease protein
MNSGDGAGRPPMLLNPAVDAAVTEREPRLAERERELLAAGAPRRRRIGPRTLNLIALAVAFGAWEFVGRLIVTKRIFFVPITTVVADMWDWTTSGDIFPHLEESAKEFAIGFGVAIAVGLVIGFAMGLSRTIFNLLDPIVSAFNATPLLALTPLFIIWFGIGLESKIVMILFLASFPILINTSAGVRDVQREHLDVVRAFGANWLDLTVKVRLPSALSFIIAGLRLGMARALVGIFVVELFGSQRGIGYTISSAAQIFDTKRVFSGIIVLAGAGVLFSILLTKVERAVAPWRYRQQESGL